MAKATIYTNLFYTKTINVKECPLSGENPYQMNFNKALSHPSLFDNISFFKKALCSALNKSDTVSIVCKTCSELLNDFVFNIEVALQNNGIYDEHFNLIREEV